MQSIANKPIMLSVVMLKVFMLSVVMLKVFMLSVFMLSVFMLSVFMLSVFKLSVVAPYFAEEVSYLHKMFIKSTSGRHELDKK
jgi:hypothetical protein